MSENSTELSFRAMDGLMAERERSYHEGILDGKRDNPNVKFFSTIEGSGITYFEFYPLRDRVLTSPTVSESRHYAYFHFMLCSDIEFYTQGGTFLEQFDSGSCSFGFLQTGQVVEVNYQANTFYRYACIHLDPQLLEQLMPSCDICDNRLQRQQHFSVVKSLPISNIQLQLINELFVHNAYQGPLSTLYRESKLLELICVTVSNFQHDLACPHIDLSKKDIAALNKARSILLEDITDPPSLKALANRAGTNEFKLKKGFKQLFGQTVYGMVHEVRLLEAKRLITHEGSSVQDAASWVGYKSASHFSTIFKRKFGILPNRLRREIEAEAVDDALFTAERIRSK